MSGNARKIIAKNWCNLFFDNLISSYTYLQELDGPTTCVSEKFFMTGKDKIFIFSVVPTRTSLANIVTHQMQP